MTQADIEALFRKHAWEEAYHAAVEWVRLHPTNAWAHAYLGLALDRMKRPEDAVPCFERAVSLDAGFWQAGTYLVRILDRLGKYEQALLVAEEFHRQRPSDENLRIMVDGLRRHAKANRTDGWERTANLTWHEVNVNSPDQF